MHHLIAPLGFSPALPHLVWAAVMHCCPESLKAGGQCYRNSRGMGLDVFRLLAGDNDHNIPF